MSLPPSAAELTAVLRYAQTVMPLTTPPDVPRLHYRFTVSLHGVDHDALVAFLAVNDDLSWNVKSWDDSHDVYWTATLALTHCELTFFSQHYPTGSTLVDGPSRMEWAA